MLISPPLSSRVMAQNKYGLYWLRGKKTHAKILMNGNAFLWAMLSPSDPLRWSATTLCWESFSPGLPSLPNYLLHAKSARIQKKLGLLWRKERCVGTKGHSFILACNPSSAALKASQVFHQTPTPSIFLFFFLFPSFYFFLSPLFSSSFWKVINIISSAALTQLLTSASLLGVLPGAVSRESPKRPPQPQPQPGRMFLKEDQVVNGRDFFQQPLSGWQSLDLRPSSPSCVGLDAGCPQ